MTFLWHLKFKDLIGLYEMDDFNLPNRVKKYLLN